MRYSILTEGAGAGTGLPGRTVASAGTIRRLWNEQETNRGPRDPHGRGRGGAFAQIGLGLNAAIYSDTKMSPWRVRGPPPQRRGRLLRPLRGAGPGQDRPGAFGELLVL
ncbi:MAG: hypothetical protein MZV70_22105 [Desulfobacterales bacterium]|nr:hypothetical protein [Desulfobacterales bacterium]